VDILVAPPVPGDPSYQLWKEECDKIYNSLKTRAKLVVNRLNSLKGIVCQPPEGAMYAFPKITLPPGAISAAKKEGITPDTFFLPKIVR